MWGRNGQRALLIHDGKAAYLVISDQSLNGELERRQAAAAVR